MRVIVTGAAGFIGANIVAALNRRGIDDVVAVDDLTDGTKVANLVDLRISDYVDRADFYTRFAAGAYGRPEAVFHQGACSDTMEHDGRYMMATNYEASRLLLDACAAQRVRLLYASSAATYGGSTTFVEEPRYECPLNVYGYSKLLFDNVVRRRLPELQIQVAGFRYFNVYGPRETHKGRMASVAFHHARQLRDTGQVKLFGGYNGYGAGEQQRDFVHVDDVVAVNLWFFDHPDRRGVFNLGTGRAQPFNDVAHAAINAWRRLSGLPRLSLGEQVDAQLLAYSDFPDALKGRYQSFTQADLSRLHDAGCLHQFRTVDDGVDDYVTRLLAGGSA